jgi:sodium/hydrogen exchanger 8
MFGTIISTFVVGGLSFYAAKAGLVKSIDGQNPMEALAFGALISAVDPVATLSIMGSADLHCDPLLYSLVFGESVLNDAIAIVLFKTFRMYYNPDGPAWSESAIPSALLSFVTVSLLSIVVGVALGLCASFIYKHTSISDFPKLETSLLFCFCYLSYATAEAISLSGIMALFFNGVVLSHYNSYNLSTTAHVASEQIFATLATVTETIVFLYMGMGVFTGRFRNWDIVFSVLALSFCLLGRALNIFPLSLIANLCRTRNRISGKMQGVLWFVGLRGAIAFALSENMPGPNKETYKTCTLSICIFTTVVCGGFTERIVTKAGMKRNEDDMEDLIADEGSSSLIAEQFPSAQRASAQMYGTVKEVWKKLDDDYLKVYFGGSSSVQSGVDHTENGRTLGNYELTGQRSLDEID